MKVGIIGMGPVGMTLAVKLKQTGYDVIICEKDKTKLSQILENGITLEGLIKATSEFDKGYSSINEMIYNESEFDCLLFSLKSYQLKEAAVEANNLINKKLTIISAQNGIDVEEILSAIFGSSQILRLVLNFAGNLSALNKVNVTFFNRPNYIGSIDNNRTDQAISFANKLTEVDLDTENVDSLGITKKIWEKTILNSALSAICAVGRFTMSEAMKNTHNVQLVEHILEEGINVAKAEKIYLSENFFDHCMGYLKKAGDHFPSLAGDLINNCQTEIDFFNGKIVDYGKKHSIGTPINLSLTNMIKAISIKKNTANLSES